MMHERVQLLNNLLNLTNHPPQILPLLFWLVGVSLRTLFLRLERTAGPRYLGELHPVLKFLCKVHQSTRESTGNRNTYQYIRPKRYQSASTHTHGCHVMELMISETIRSLAASDRKPNGLVGWACPLRQFDRPWFPPPRPSASQRVLQFPTCTLLV